MSLMDIAPSVQSTLPHNHDQDYLDHAVILYPLFYINQCSNLCGMVEYLSCMTPLVWPTVALWPQGKDKRLGKSNFSINILRVQMSK